MMYIILDLQRVYLTLQVELPEMFNLLFVRACRIQTIFLESSLDLAHGQVHTTLFEGKKYTNFETTFKNQFLENTFYTSVCSCVLI